MLVVIPAVHKATEQYPPPELPYLDIAVKYITSYWNRLGIECKFVYRWPPEYAVSRPTWIKELAPRLFPGHDFYICQDLDLIPVPGAADVREYIRTDCMNMALSMAAVSGMCENHPHFKYQAGLMCYPATMADTLFDIWNQYHGDPLKWYDGIMAGDQYYLNMYLGENNIHVHELPRSFNQNYIIGTSNLCANFLHFTYTIPSSDKRQAIDHMERDIWKSG